MYNPSFPTYLSVYILIKSEFISSCSRPAVCSNIVQITRATFFVNVFLTNGRRQPFWMSENHIRSHLWPFQLFLLFLFLTKWPPAAILDIRNSLLSTLQCIALIHYLQHVLTVHIGNSPVNSSSLLFQNIHKGLRHKCSHLTIL